MKDGAIIGIALMVLSPALRRTVLQAFVGSVVYQLIRATLLVPRLVGRFQIFVLENFTGNLQHLPPETRSPDNRI